MNITLGTLFCLKRYYIETLLDKCAASSLFLSMHIINPL